MRAPDKLKQAASATSAARTDTTSLNGNKQRYIMVKRQEKQQLQTPSFRLLFSLDFFSQGEFEKNDKPDWFPYALRILIFIAFLCGCEQLACWVLAQLQGTHPLLENETNRQILARHIGVDTVSCFIVSVLGWKARHISQGVLDRIFVLLPQRQNPKSSNNRLPMAGHEARLYTYHPEAFRIVLLFFAYQVKNLYDSLVWHDGPEFVFHHVFCLFTAAGVMRPGCVHYYAIFFCGYSELSTALLCILANFDDEHGVPGLGDALPIPRLILGVTFVVSFLVCRCTLWPLFSYYLCRDVLQALQNSRQSTTAHTAADPRTEARKLWLYFFLISVSFLSALQVAWLGQIVVLAKQEFEKMGLM